MRPSDKRRYPRMKKKLHVQFYKTRFYFLKGQTNAAEIQDVSKGGVRVNTGVGLARGERIVLLVKSRLMGSVVQFSGRVVWARRLRHEGVPFTQAGVRFLSLSGEQSLLIFRVMTG
jgi:hypothetical protein